MKRLAQRSLQPELMDSDDLTQDTYTTVVAHLAQVNTITRARPPTLNFIRHALRHVPSDVPITILDVGFGDGDMLRALARMLQHRSNLRLLGYDINPRSIVAAQSRTPSHLPILYCTGDAVTIDPAQSIDFIISSLVTHHMGDDEIVGFLSWMDARATRGWFVNDLHRSAFARHAFRLLAFLARWHPIVRHDGALSVKRSFVRSDWVRFSGAAGLELDRLKIRWRLPFRWCLERLK